MKTHLHLGRIVAVAALAVAVLAAPGTARAEDGSEVLEHVGSAVEAAVGIGSFVFEIVFQAID